MVFWCLNSLFRWFAVSLFSNVPLIPTKKGKKYFLTIILVRIFTLRCTVRLIEVTCAILLLFFSPSFDCAISYMRIYNTESERAQLQ